MEEAIGGGFRDFDVAPAYGNGVAERTLGEVTGRTTTKIGIHTKYGIPVTEYGGWSDGIFALRRVLDIVGGTHRTAYETRSFEPEALFASLQRSLARLRRSKVEILFLHEPLGPLGEANWRSVCGAMLQLLDEGLIGAWGVAGSTVRYRWHRDLPDGGVVQVPIVEWRRDPSLGGGRRLILYGLHAAYEGVRTGMSFGEYLRDLASEIPNARFVVATTRRERLESWLQEP